MYQASLVSSDDVLQFGSGAEYDAKAFAELGTLHDKLTTLRDRAISDDALEYRIAVEELKGYCFSDGYDKDASDAVFKAILDENDDLWRQFDEHFQHIHATKDNPKRILTTTYQDWAETVTQLEGIEEQIPTLTVDSWQGAAANSYRAKLPERQEEMTQLKTLATASRNGLEAVAELQSAILTALKNSMEANSRGIEEYLDRQSVDEAKLRALFKNSYWDFKPNNQEQYSFKFYRRTKTLSAYFRAMVQHAGLRLDNQDKGDWVPSSEEIQKYFESSLTAATQGREASDYQGRDFDTRAEDEGVQDQEGTRMER